MLVELVVNRFSDGRLARQRRRRRRRRAQAAPPSPFPLLQDIVGFSLQHQ